MKASEIFLNLLLKNWWLRHLVFWLFYYNYFALGLLFPWLQNLNAAYLATLIFLPGFLTFTYANLYFLIPKFIVKKQLLLFFIGYITLLVIVVFIMHQLVLILPEPASPILAKSYKWSMFDFRKIGNIMPYIQVSAVAITIKLIKFSYFQENTANNALQQKKVADLELLKAQIHPHFLFNTLNNLFAHTMSNSPEASKIVRQLSSILKFMIYNSQDEMIPLTKEIELLQNYIDLEKLRYGKDLDIAFNISGDTEGKFIRPLLLLPLIENSFKYGTSQQLENSWISFNLKVDKGILSVDLSNSRDPDGNKQTIPGKSVGIGLENVKQRLKLLYPGRHHFAVREEEKSFHVSMEIKMNKDSHYTIRNLTKVNELSSD